MDRISSLPPTIIESILCLLPIQEAARTSVLSKEWRYIWTKIPKLVFDEDTLVVSTNENQLSVMEENYKTPSLRKDMNLMCKFFYAIYQILLAHQGPILEFTLAVFAVDSCIEIDQILAYLSRQNTVMKLTLELQNEYKLPSSIFSLHHLTNLSLTFLKIDHEPRFNGFPSLTTLCLKNVNISKKTLRHLISNCPLLKSFSLVSSYWYIYFYSRTSVTLNIVNCFSFQKIVISLITTITVPPLLSYLTVYMWLNGWLFPFGAFRLYFFPNWYIIDSTGMKEIKNLAYWSLFRSMVQGFFRRCCSTRASNYVSPPQVHLFRAYVCQRQILDALSCALDEKLSELGDLRATGK